MTARILIALLVLLAAHPSGAEQAAPQSPLAVAVPGTQAPPAGEAETPPGGPESEAPPAEEVPGEPPLEAAPPPAQPPAPVPAPRAYAPPGGGFLVKFNNADVYEVIHTLGRIAGINYLIDPRVRGVVNIHTQGTVRREDALELLFSILRINGATAVLEGSVYHIVPMAEAKMEPLSTLDRPAPRDGSSPNRVVMRAFPLQFISASEMAKVIRPFLSAGGDATEVPRANMLLVTDTEGNLEKHARLIELFDADAFRSAGVRLFPLKFLDPEEMGKNLEAIFGALDFGVKGGKPSGINFVPLGRMNALLVVTASPRSMEEVSRWIEELDRETAGTARQVHLYRVRHGKAKDLMDILEKLFPGKTSKGPEKGTEFRPKVAEAGAPLAAAAARAPERAPAQGGSTPEGERGQEFDIILNEPMNAVIVRGSASEWVSILETLKTLDVYPRQILLEVLIAEVQLDESLRLGVDWTYFGQHKDVSHDVSLITSAAGISSGLKYVVQKTDTLTAAVRALANDGKVSILSSPSVISTNGKESKIDVADQVPIVSGRVTTSSAEPLVTETVEYRDVGIILTFTPYINDEGIVTLEISQEVSDVLQETFGGTSNPSFFKRSVKTTMIATQDRSIVLGGLVKERRQRSRDGVPFLYKIPFIGWIFGSRSGRYDRTELLIFITPRVIGSVEEGTRLSREFEDRVENLKKAIREAGGLKVTPGMAPKDQ